MRTGLLGSRHIQKDTAAQHSAGSAAQGAGNTQAAHAEPRAIITHAVCLARSGIARWVRQPMIIGPKRR